MCTYGEAHAAMKALVGLRPAVMSAISIEQDDSNFYLLLQVAPEYVKHKYPHSINGVELRVRAAVSTYGD